MCTMASLRLTRTARQRFRCRHIFDALNRDFRYQLTALGAPAPNLHIKDELKGGRFRIGGAAASQRISWQVTGVRQDVFANAHRIVVEEEKRPGGRGYYR